MPLAIHCANFNNHPTRCFVVTKIHQNRTFQMNNYSNTSEGPSSHKRCNCFFSWSPYSITSNQPNPWSTRKTIHLLGIGGFNSLLLLSCSDVFLQGLKASIFELWNKLDDVGLEKNLGNFEQCFQILILSKEITDCLKQFILIIFFLYFSQWCCETYQFQISEWVPTIKTDRASS